MCREIIFIADDFGWNAPVNAAVLAAHRDGALHGASLMLGQPGTAAAVAAARATPTLQIGWHLHLCHSQPLTTNRWPWGDSPARAGFAIGLSRHAARFMRTEVAAQWEQFCATSLPCAFVNVHHHLHAHPAVYRALRDVLPRNFGGWIRLGTPKFFAPQANEPLPTGGTRSVASGGSTRPRRSVALHKLLDVFWQRRRRRSALAVSDTLWGIDRLHKMQAAEVAAAIATLPTGRHEFMFHPQAISGDAEVACLIELRRCGMHSAR